MTTAHVSVFVAIAAFVSMLILKTRGFELASNYCGVVFHLSLLPLVSVLPAPELVKMAGYSWLFLDTAIGMAEIGSIDPTIAWNLRMGAHVAACIWICGVSIELATAPLIVGLVLGIWMGGHAFVSPFVPKKVLFLSGPLMIVWLALIIAYPET